MLSTGKLPFLQVTQGTINDGYTDSWSNIGRVLDQDEYEATVYICGTNWSQWLRLYGPEISIPSNATVKGIAIEVTCQNPVYPGGPNIQTYIGFSGSRVGNNRTINSLTTDEVLGSNADLWGLTSLTPGNLPNLEFWIRGFADQDGEYTLSIDYVSVEIFYTVPVATSSSCPGMPQSIPDVVPASLPKSLP